MANDGVMLVNFGGLDEVGANIDRALQTMRARLDECDKIGAQLLEHWDSNAQKAYYDRQKVWTDASQELAEILLRIRNAVQQSTEEYMATEKQATQRFQ